MDKEIRDLKQREIEAQHMIMLLRNYQGSSGKHTK